jgi:pimeloyl-ACP methyl ester carboxylesterase
MDAPRYIYCHGLPGSERELDFLAAREAPSGRLTPLDRLSRPRDQGDWAQRALDAFDQATRRAAEGPVRLIGFSLGAMTALRLAEARPDVVEHVHLIAPAAPLELGDFLPRMAGRAVFQTARGEGPALSLLSRIQRTTASLAPGLLFKALFDGVAASERQLAADPAFRDALQHGLGLCLGSCRAAYQEELRAYVRPWSARLEAVRCPVSLWHGLEDTWAPDDMSDRLAERLSGPAHVNKLAGLGHFGALRHALPRILAAD